MNGRLIVVQNFLEIQAYFFSMNCKVSHLYGLNILKWLQQPGLDLAESRSQELDDLGHPCGGGDPGT